MPTNLVLKLKSKNGEMKYDLPLATLLVKTDPSISEKSLRRLSFHTPMLA